MNQLTTMTYQDLLECVERFEKAGLLEADTPISLRVGGGTQTKTVTGYVLSNDGLVLTISGNEPSVKPRKPRKPKATAPATIGPGEPA